MQPLNPPSRQHDDIHRVICPINQLVCSPILSVIWTMERGSHQTSERKINWILVRAAKGKMGKLQLRTCHRHTRISCPTSASLGTFSNLTGPQCSMDAVLGDRYRWIDGNSFVRPSQCDRQYWLPECKRYCNFSVFVQIQWAHTLYDALLMLTLRPRLVNVHLMRTKTFRRIFESLLAGDDFKMSRNSVWSHWCV